MSTRAEKLAAIVGVARHVDARLDLRTAENDARDLLELLTKQHGYECHIRCNEKASLRDLRSLFERELPERVNEHTRLLVYFAGHGLVVDSLSRPMGYLVPCDASDDVTSLWPMEDVYAALEKLPCKHVLVVLDCCFAGAFRWGARRDFGVVHAPEMYRERYERFLRRPAWQLLASAAADEKAVDVLAGMAYGARGERDDSRNSPFADAMLRALEGDADGVAGDGVITATELYAHLRRKIDRLQTPGLWPLSRHDQGEYIFHVVGRTIALHDAPTLARETSPYRGLESYGEEHADRFFGRSEVVVALLAHVATHQLTLVVAASGAGKSSVVKAGLIPAYRSRYPGAEVFVSRPRERRDGVIERACDKSHADRERLLVIDQLEEVFTLDQDAASRDRYLASLAGAMAAGVRVIATLRSDFEVQLINVPLPDLQASRFVLREMTRDELRETIEGPANQAVLFFDPPKLVERLVDAVVDTPGALPLLSFVLSQMYERLLVRADDSRTLLESDYLDLGGISGALRDRLEAIHSKLDPASRTAMKSILLRLIEFEGGTVVRRPLRATDLEFGEPRVNQVCAELTAPAARLVVAGGATLELVHDAVIRSWPRFDDWLRDRETVDALVLERRIETATQEWQDAKRDPRRLWNGDPRLDLAVALGARPLQLNKHEVEFVSASVRRRRNRRAQVGLAITSAIAILAVVGVIALIRAREAKEAQLAEQRRAIAENGAVAGLLAPVPGREREALVRGIHAVESALTLDTTIPPVASDGLIAAIATLGQRRSSVARHVHEEPHVWRAVCSDDGEFVLSVARDAAVVARPDGKELHRLGRGGLAAAFGGGRMITGSAGVEVWNPDGSQSAALSIDGTVTCLSASKDASRILALTFQGQATVWTDSTEPAQLVQAHAEGLTCAIDASGRIAATSGWGEPVRIWSVNERSGLLVLRCEQALAVMRTGANALALDFSPDGSRLLIGGGSSFEIVDTSDCRVVVEPPPLTESQRLAPEMRGMVFTADGLDVVTAGADGIIQRWDALSGRPLEVVARTDRALTTVDTCGPGRLVTGDETGNVTILEETPDASLRSLRIGTKPTAIAFLPGVTSTLAIVSDAEADAATLVDLETGVARQLPGATGRPWAVAFSADGSQVHALARGSSVLHWDAESLRPAAGSNLGRVGRGALSRDGTTIAAMQIDGLQIWSGAGSTTAGHIAVDADPVNLFVPPALSHDGRFVAVIEDKRIRIWNTRDLREVSSLPQLRIASSMALSSDGRHLLVGGVGGVVQLYETATRKVVHELLAHTGDLWATGFSPDGRRFATAGGDRIVRVWDLASGAQVAALPGSQGRVFGLAFSDDGETIAAASLDGATRIYTLDPRRLLRLACERARQLPVDAELDAACDRANQR